MNPRELPDVKTPVSIPALCRALWHAYTALAGKAPTRAIIELLVAWWGLETGWGKACHCFNLGNVKGKAGGTRCWVYFACGEEFTEAYYEPQAGDARVILVRRYTRKGVPMVSVKLLPKHPGSCFRAFEDLEAGAVDWLTLTHDKYPEAWVALATGNPATLAHAARIRGYYTADEAEYTETLVGCLPHVRSFKIDWGLLENPPEPPPVVVHLIPLERDLPAEKAERDREIWGDD